MGEKVDFQKARFFLYDHARLVERRMFEFLFETGSRQAVVSAIKAYQNPDGGFGNAFEPDKRTPFSQPLDVQVALEALDRCGALTDDQVKNEMLLPVCNYLSSVTIPEGGVSCVLPTTSGYPSAPWWQLDPAKPLVGDLNPTAAITGLLLKAGVQHPWIDEAVQFCWRAIDALEVDWYHTLICVLTFLENTPQRQQAEAALARIESRLRKPGVIELNPGASGYVQMPLDWAPTPNHFCRKLFDQDMIDIHLAALKARQKEDGGWPISWEASSIAVEMEWRGIRTLDVLITLRAYGALDD